MKKIQYFLAALFVVTLIYSGCKKDDNGDDSIPYIEVLGYTNINHELGLQYNDTGALAWDITINGDTIDITDRLVVNNPVDVNTAGTYHVTYNASDEAGNQADERKRTVNVVITK